MIHSNDLIKEKIDNNNYIFYIDKNSDKTLLYSLENGTIYINKEDYTGQPHIITLWTHKNINGYYGLCLTMDRDHRDHTLNSTDMLKRAKQIVFEEWDDKIYERFKELNITLSAIKYWKYIIKDNNLFQRDYINNRVVERNANIIEIEFSGEDMSEIIELVKPKIKNNFNLLNVKYKNRIKQFIIETIGGQYLFRICDNYTHEVMFGRTNEKDLSKYNFIVVGVGSVGSEVIDTLIKMGAKNIDIYDDDNFGSHNTPRHFLGARYLKEEENKALSTKEFYEERYPFLNIRAFPSKFDYKEINNATHIFNTTGGSNTERTKQFLEVKNCNQETIIIDIFVEPYAAGTHMVVSDWGSIISNYEIKWQDRCIVNQEKDFRIDFEGCFVPTLPYGYIPIKVSVPQLIRHSIKSNFELGHFSSFAVDLSEIDKNYINTNIKAKIDYEKVGVMKW